MTERSELHPSAGARFLFERKSVGPDGAAAVYAAAIFTPDARIDYDVDMALDGSYDVRPRAEPADAELTKKLDTIARLIARSAASKKRDGLLPWPHRVLRWRGPGRG